MLEKDTRRLRKEAYKTESALVKLQEELKATRNSLRIAQSSVESEKAKSFKREQETFAAEYKLVGVQEELSTAQERIKVIEEERDVLKKSLKEEEVARIAAEGRIALPTGNDDDEFASPKKSPRKKSPFSDTEEKENMAPARTIETKALKEELNVQRRLRQRAEDQVEFMKMECQFQCCSCRMAEQRGGQYVHDRSFELEMQHIRQAASRELSPPLTDEETEAKLDAALDHHMVDVAETSNEKEKNLPRQAKYDDQSGTFQSISRPGSSDSQKAGSPLSPVKEVSTNAQMPSEPEMDHLDETVLHKEADPELLMKDSALSVWSSPVKEEHSDIDMAALPETPRVPHTPKYREVRTVTTTTTIPLAFTPSSTPAPMEDFKGPMTPATIAHPPALKAAADSSFPASPGAALRPDGTLDREAALEQIRLRRGRARSVAMGLGTPKKQMIEGVARRDISAPALKGR